MTGTVSRVRDAIQLDRAAKRFGIARASYTDPEIYKLEMEKIFATCWLYVGHDSEIRKPGDFKSRTLAGRSLVFLRDRNSEVRCFLNVCPHRGAQLCRLKEGNARSFGCIYHGWVFENTGRVSQRRRAGNLSEGF